MNDTALPQNGRLDAAFRVTPGSLALLAFFGDAPLPAGAARRALREAVAACPARPLRFDCLAPSPIPGERARARAVYPVVE